MLSDGEILAPIYGLVEGGSKLQMSGFEFVNMVDYGLKDERQCRHRILFALNLHAGPQKF